MMLSDVCLTSVCLSVAYIGPKSRTERPNRKTKIGTEVAHVTRDSDTTVKVKRSKVKVTCEAGHIVAASCLQLVKHCAYLLPQSRRPSIPLLLLVSLSAE